MLLVPLPWATRVWALPFGTVLAPSERDHQERGQRHQQLTDWARPMLLRVRRWVRERSWVLGTDSRVAVMTLRWRRRPMPQPLCSLTRVRWDAALYEPAPPRKLRQNGRPRLKGQRWPTLAQVVANPATPWVTATVRGWVGAREQVVPLVSATAVWSHAGMPVRPIRGVLVRDPHEEFEPQALLWTDMTVDSSQLLEWFVLRWRLAVTWQEARAHLGMDTPRPWNTQAIARTTPALLGLFSMMTLGAGPVAQEHGRPIRQALWYRTVQPTCAEAIAVGRQHLWTSTHFYMSPTKPDMVEIPHTLLNHLTETLCYAA